MYRLFEKKLQSWKNGGMRKPLMVVGARKVGKTYTIKKFCEENFSNYLYFNLATDNEIKSIFEKTLSDKMIFERLELCLGRKIDPENTVIFFDEIQVSKNFISSLQYFSKSKNPYRIICTGNLLGVKMNRVSNSSPCEKVRIEYMYPMNFEEFLIAVGRKSLAKQIKDCYAQMSSMPDVEHEEAFNLYRKYLCVGGLPEAVNNLIENDLNMLSYSKEAISNIVDIYSNDMKNYVKSVVETKKLKKIYYNIPTQLVNEKKNFRYNLIDGDGRRRKYELPMNWLLNANLILRSYEIKNAQIPLNIFEESFNLYLNDVGILTLLSETNYTDIMLNKEFAYREALVKNYVAEEFTTNGIPLYFWTHGRNARVDFFICNDDGVIPVVVKSGDNVSITSINSYIRENHPPYVIRLASTNFYFLHGVRSVPMYAAFCIKDK